MSEGGNVVSGDEKGVSADENVVSANENMGIVLGIVLIILSL
jgi:hypothetical protein